jgi:sugar (pentulose or hexulose) kinase
MALERQAEIVLALDVGTGGARVSAYDTRGALVASGAATYPSYYDQPSWAEQDAELWWSAARVALRQAVTSLSPRMRVRAIGLTGQSPTVVPVDGNGAPLRRGLSYQDNRATEEAAAWSARAGGRALVHQRTGHEPAAFYIGPKLLWIRRHEPDIFARARAWLQPRDLVAHRLTGTLATDWSHAGSTLLFDILTRTWALDLAQAQDLPTELFPPALAPWSEVGVALPAVAAEVGLPPGVPVVIGGADSQCCAVGAGVMRSSMLSDMAGTSTCLNAPVRHPLADGRIANYCHVVPDWWCTELGLNASGAAFAWLAAVLAAPGELPAFAMCEQAAERAPAGAGGLIFLPYIADGERFDPTLRGGLYGLSLRHGRPELARAVLEGVAFAMREHVATMAQAGAPIAEIHVSGGGARSAVWNQIKADIIGTPVVAVASDATSLGVALVAGTAVGLWNSLDEAVAQCVRVRERYEPVAARQPLYDDLATRFSALARQIAEQPADETRNTSDTPDRRDRRDALEKGG